MIYNNNQIFAKVWKVTPSEKYIDLQVSTSEKDQEGEYKYSSWFVRVIGHAFNSLKDVKEGDRITITKSKFTNERYQNEAGEWRSSFKFVAFEAGITEELGSPTPAPVVRQEVAPAETASGDSTANCPW